MTGPPVMWNAERMIYGYAAIFAIAVTCGWIAQVGKGRLGLGWGALALATLFIASVYLQPPTITRDPEVMRLNKELGLLLLALGDADTPSNIGTLGGLMMATMIGGPIVLLIAATLPSRKQRQTEPHAASSQSDTPSTEAAGSTADQTRRTLARRYGLPPSQP